MFLFGFFENRFWAGMSLLRLGDTVWIERNLFFGLIANADVAAVDLSMVTGAARLLLLKNNCTMKRGFLQAVSGSQIEILGNQVEQVLPSGATPPAMVSLLGTTERHGNCIIMNNNFNGHDECDHNIVIEAADDTQIAMNTMIDSTLESVYVGLSAARTRFGHNAGTATVQDHGTDTKKISYVVL